MRKKKKLILFMFLCLVLFTSIVYAKDTDCDFIFGAVNDKDSVAHFLQDVFNIFKYGGPILCIVLSMVDFIKATASQDKDFLTKAVKRTGTRIVLALLLFFIPVVINFLFTLFGWTGTCGIS